LLALQSDLIADSFADLFATLGSHSFGDTESRQTTWLSAEDTTRTLLSVGVVKYHLCYLRSTVHITEPQCRRQRMTP